MGSVLGTLAESVRSGDQPRVFLSMQVTVKMVLKGEWYGLMLFNSSLKASIPSFNNPRHINLPSAITKFDVPVFGPRILKATMAIFNQPGIVHLAKELNLTIPQNQLNTFVQKKMVKVHEMINAAREVPTLAGSQKAAIEKLEIFIKEFEALIPEELYDVSEWNAFLGRHVESGWEERLHFDHILGMFGFSEEAALQLRKMEFVWPDGERVSYEQHALRWLSKSFAAYGPPGTVTDVVNLIYAMTSSPAAEKNESCIADTVSNFGQRVASKDFDGLWIPTHYAMDAENDDTLCWLLLEHMHRTLGSKLSVLVQLPTDPVLDDLASDLEAKGCEILRDPDSTNINAIKKYWGLTNSTPSPAAGGTTAVASR